ERVNSYSAGGGHWSRSIVFGPDSGMYVTIGSTCNMCVEKTPDRAAVMRYDENGGNGRVFSSGLRNAVGIAVNPATKQIWVTQNERDNVEPDHENLPPEEINIRRMAAISDGHTVTGIGSRVRTRTFTIRRAVRRPFLQRSQCRRT